MSLFRHARHTEGIREFARSYRLHIKRDACGDEIIAGRLGQLYDHGGGRFGMALEDPAGKPSRARMLLARRRKAILAGFELHQAGDVEAILLFDPENRKQAKFAIRLVGTRQKRRSSPEQLANLRRHAFISPRPRARSPFTTLGRAHIAGTYPKAGNLPRAVEGTL